MTQTLVRTLNLKNFTHGTNDQRTQFADEFAEGLRDCGFITLEGHGIDPNLIAENYDAFKRLFELPLDTKKKYVGANGGQRGYTGFGKEHAKNRTVGDLKEFWHVGQELPLGHALSSEYPLNVWVDELPELRVRACASTASWSAWRATCWKRWR